MATAPLTQTTGRRKEAVARVRIVPGTGEWKVPVGGMGAVTTALARTATRTCPGAGSGDGASTRVRTSPGSPSCWTCRSAPTGAISPGPPTGWSR